MRSLTKVYLINASKEKVWDALVNPEIIEEWGGGPAVMNDQQGAEFTLWGGDIFGRNIDVKPPEELVQEWYGGEWKEPSIVTFKLSDLNGKTKVELIHTNIPDNEEPEINEGWDKYYMGPIKNLFEES